jgi:hypothetical protein
MLPDDYRAHALVRDPFNRFASTFNEVLRRAIMFECPEGPCEAERDHFTETSLKSLQSQPWFEPAQKLCRTKRSSPHRTNALRAAIGSFAATTSCNLQYYASEHTMSQTLQLVAQGGGPVKPWAGEVMIHHLEEIATPSQARSSTFFKAMRVESLSESVIESCFKSNTFMTHGTRPKHSPRIPQSVTLLSAAGDNVTLKGHDCELPDPTEVLALVENDPALLFPLTTTYAQDVLCLGYTPPARVTSFLGDLKYVRGGWAASRGGNIDESNQSTAAVPKLNSSVPKSKPNANVSALKPTAKLTARTWAVDMMRRAVSQSIRP